MKPVVIILNGPPFSGKDFLAEEARKNFRYNTAFYCKVLQFKKKLFDLTKLIYSVSDEEWDRWYERDLKEVPREELGGLSPRTALQHVSENVIKPIFGKDYFGKSLAKEIKDGVNYVVSDGGFPEELVPVCEKADVTVICILSDGCDYTGDTRRYLDESEVNGTVIDFYNHKDFASVLSFCKLVTNIVEEHNENSM